MKRSISVILVGILALLGSILALASGILMAVVLAVSGSSNAAMRAPGAKVGVFLGVAFLVLLSIWGVSTAIGVFLLKRWARISIIVFGAFLILGGFFGGLMILVMPLPSAGQSDASSFAAVKVGMGVFYLLMGAIGLWWVLLFNSRSVKEQFAGSQLTTDGTGKPVSISIIAWLLIFGCAFTPFGLAMRMPVAFMGLLLTGWAAAAVFVLLGACQLYIALGLLRLNPRSRVLAIYYSVFGGLNGILIYALPGREARMAALMKAMPAYLHQPMPTPMPFPYWPFAVMIAAFMLVQIYFLTTRKSAFYTFRPLADPAI
jgi:hypothetical protein